MTILRIIYLNPGISRKKIIKKYNSSHIFEERVRRLERRADEILPPSIEPIKAPMGPANVKPTKPPIRLPHMLIKKF